MALAAEARLPAMRDLDRKAVTEGSLEKGREAISKAIKDQACTDCHKFHDAGDLGSAPDLTDYGSYEWLKAFIANPAHARFYGPDGNDRMPAFAASADNSQANLLSDHDVDMLVRWLRGDDRDLQLKLAKPPVSETAAKPEPPAAKPEPSAAKPEPSAAKPEP